MTLTEILNRLEGVRGGHGQYTARCPAHDDRRNSLSVSVGKDGNQSALGTEIKIKYAFKKDLTCCTKHSILLLVTKEVKTCPQKAEPSTLKIGESSSNCSLSKLTAKRWRRLNSVCKKSKRQKKNGSIKRLMKNSEHEKWAPTLPPRSRERPENQTPRGFCTL